MLTGCSTLEILEKQSHFSVNINKKKSGWSKEQRLRKSKNNNDNSLSSKLRYKKVTQADHDTGK